MNHTLYEKLLTQVVIQSIKESFSIGPKLAKAASSMSNSVPAHDTLKTATKTSSSDSSKPSMAAPKISIGFVKPSQSALNSSQNPIKSLSAPSAPTNSRKPEKLSSSDINSSVSVVKSTTRIKSEEIEESSNLHAPSSDHDKNKIEKPKPHFLIRAAQSFAKAAAAQLDSSKVNKRTNKY